MKRPIVCEGFYGDEVVPLALPEGTRILRPPPPHAPLADVEGAVRAALQAPIAHRPVRELVGRGARVAIAFDDPAVAPMTDPDFREIAIGALLQELTEAGVRPGDIRLICANALHRKWMRFELARILGQGITTFWPPHRLYCHDAEDPTELCHLGETERGIEVEVNRAVVEADQFFYVNLTLTPMNGGWKSIVVGLSSFRSIRHHHRPFPATGHSIMDPKRSAFRKILWEMGDLLIARLASEGKKPFTIEGVLNSATPPQIAAVHAGSIPEVHEKTLEFLATQQSVPVTGQSDALLLSLPNQDPYSQFSTINPLLVTNLALAYSFGLYEGVPLVREGGVLIIHHPLSDTFDDARHPAYRPFYEEILPETKDPFEIWDRYVEDYAHRPEFLHRYRYAYGFHGTHPFFMWNSTNFPRRHLGRIVFAAPRKPEVAQWLGFESFPSLDAALDSVAADFGNGFSLTYHPTLPITIARVCP
ncbi:MAG: DUF2088 domain-containing protein [Deltaproteobacteria bacterium]|nr:MAG: DUF2088 domain-containing protein [Deltaproteobacteria bacterium]